MSQDNKPIRKEEMRVEYDIRGGARGKYYRRYQQGVSVALLGATKILAQDHLRTILESGNFDELIGAVENDWLECKAAPYRLEEDYQKQELAKDVCALGNVNGGVILLGVRTERNPTHFGDEIKEVRILPQKLINPDQYHDTLKSWIYPAPQQVEIKWFPSNSNLRKGIVAIFIPRQASARKPLLLARTLDAKGKRIEIVFGYVERRRAGVDPRSVQDLHVLLKDGLRFESLDRRFDNIYELVQELHLSLSDRVQEALSELRLRETAVRYTPSHPDFLKLLDDRVAEALIDTELAGRRSFSLAVVPMQPVEIPALFERRDTDIVHLLESPPELRPGGFDLQMGSSARIVRGQLRRAVTPKYKSLELWRDGTLIFAATADEDFLCWGRHSTPGADLRINPLALIESTYLFAELSRRVFEETKPQPKAFEYRIQLENMALENRLCVLVPGPIGTFAWELGNDVRKPPGPRFISPLRWEEPSIKPGQVAFQLVREVYRWFGIEDSNIPYKEQSNGQLEISPQQIRKAGS